VKVAVSGGEATLEVADDGPGLAAEDASRVFDRFFRVDESRSRDDGGAGLGLSIVAAIAHAHGGSVAVDTAPGAGARFIVTLPVSPPSVP
jgi:two-component system OmpR family sensor kinase